MADFSYVFLSLFGLAEIEIKESYDTVKLTANNIALPDKVKFKEILSSINNRDRMFLSLSVGDNDAIMYHNNSTIDFFFEYENALKIKNDDENILFSIKIEKQIENGKISVYFLDKFIEYLNGDELSLIDKFNVFRRVCNNQPMFFETQIDSVSFFTQTIQFDSINEPIKISNISETRKLRTESIKSLCHNNLSKEYIPNDFHELSTSNNETIKILFRKLSIISSIAYLFDIVQINNENILYRLNGYKAISGQISFSDLKTNSADEYYKIYDWVYNDGNTIDKIGLARNIISLHFSKKNDITLNGNPFLSILSSFEIYRKQNIKQYIEIRNKISDNLLDFKNKADKIVESFANDFKKSLFAFISFFASVVVVQVLRTGNFVNVFTVDATILSMAFLFITLIFFFASKWEIKQQKKRYEQTYQNLKDRCKDLLNEDDVNRILYNDNDFNTNIEFINDKRKVYSCLWVGTIIILFISIIILFSMRNCDILKQVIKYFL
jgi:hypothetical protein